MSQSETRVSAMLPMLQVGTHFKLATLICLSLVFFCTGCAKQNEFVNAVEAGRSAFLRVEQVSVSSTAKELDTESFRQTIKPLIELVKANIASHASRIDQQGQFQIVFSREAGGLLGLQFPGQSGIDSIGSLMPINELVTESSWSLPELTPGVSVTVTFLVKILDNEKDD